MKQPTNNEIEKFVRNQGWTCIIPSDNECNKHWKGVSLEDGYKAFKVSRDNMFSAENAAFQSRTCAMSSRGANAYANNWN